MFKNSLVKLASATTLGLLLIAVPAFADTSVDASATQAVNAAVPPVVSVSAAPTETTSASLKTTNHLSFLQGRASALIDMRVSSLTKLEARINASKLSADQKASLASLIATQVGGLNDLKTQIKAGTDLTAVKALAQTIYTSFRVYAVLIPKISLLSALDAEQNHLGNLNNNVFPKVQARITAAQAKGKDVSAWQTALTSAQANAATVGDTITAQMTTASSLQPSDYPNTSKSTINGVRTAIKGIRSSFLSIQASLKFKATK